MNTTSIIVELLTAGILALIAVLLLLGVAGVDIVAAVIMDAKEHVGAITLVLIALAYSLGVVIDALADRLIDRIAPSTNGPANTRSLFSKLGPEFQGQFLGYLRAKLRLSRNLFFNSVFLSLSGALYLVVRVSHWHALAWLAGWLVVAWGAYYAWRALNAEWQRRRSEVLEN